MKRAPRIAIGAALLLLMALFCALRLEVTNEITHFLAPGEDPRLAKLSRRLTQSELTRTMILSVSAADTAQAIAVVDELAGDLAEHQEVAWVRSGWNPEHNTAFHDLYFPRRLLMLERRPRLPGFSGSGGGACANTFARRASSLLRPPCETHPVDTTRPRTRASRAAFGRSRDGLLARRSFSFRSLTISPLLSPSALRAQLGARRHPTPRHAPLAGAFISGRRSDSTKPSRRLPAAPAHTRILRLAVWEWPA